MAKLKEVDLPEGMNLRDYFAGQALLAIMSTKDAPVSFVDEGNGLDWFAVVSYSFADAMLEARK